MGVLPIVVLSALCLLCPGAAEHRDDCHFEGKIYKDGDTVTINCFICECVNGEIKDCLSAVNCPVVADKKAPQNHEEINYSDEPNVFGSSDKTIPKRKKRSLFGKPKDSGNSAGASFSLGGGILGLQSGKNMVGEHTEVKASVGKQNNILDNIPNLIPKEVKVNASFQLGGTAGLGIQGGVGVNGDEEKRTQDELRRISEEKKESSGGIAGVGIQAGISANGGEEKRIQEELRKISEEKQEKTSGKISMNHETRIGNIEKDHVNINLNGGRKDSSEEDNSKEGKGTINVGGKFSHEHGSKEEHGEIDMKIKGVNKETSHEDNKGIRFGGKFGHGHESKEEHGKIEIKVKGGSKESSHGDSSEENKGTIKFGGKFGHEHGSKEEHGRIDIKITEENKGTSHEDNSEEHKGIKFGGKFGHGHESKELHGNIDIKIKGETKESSLGENSEEKKGSIKFGSKFGHGSQEHGKIGIKLKGGNGDSSEEDNSKEHKGAIKFGGKFGNGHGSKEEHGKIGVKIKGGNKDSSEEDDSKENKGIKLLFDWECNF
ncbi:hypothetical protein GDO81_013814 [Engystomops pustulosus]|uniref:VWFC domain-containing protein n=1 Tax=Engystomops pustulosus TaxID=76066 RepID=A0AAV7B5U0_ENGPU|nr:hypothetical protein GDO81_013814 [Engystomops pustulosus]